ncbi:tRNA dihydrouridine synthase DusB [Paraclostridium bifermentans]|jgi:tRNA-dihydrouridine synthase B|uniref:tRNA-dihydrouridine synthase n=1 Tax=Paraclostridium bifermentans ATCC 638 = DSM 14991 TaxID=1233171 RepID=T4VIE3_PARBF|nr:tRNA dihydrouridine synthase DusB [Paraclostridium bifermentans]RDC50604.1 tRNA dihydrouridine synthase DusB [Acinetobacter sp. RIT592]EQK40457.1 TIM-barrel, nifR3 family protein [[Clostridium] bifermentans ATCC 638] [Paraclostridium bifermentans ATCC 638 = DSM 14991]MBS5953904.1 tRNA dihydrouridine synthase DusB [Paraclostridium bifermentans]MBU5289376.1 tRNA dihydrouridine synthase DusB [Paraclostridium bifermentans]RIZ58644.1 tRNA dihydrouridine synthase DusB [Paraclostridium bifermentan
MKIGNVTLDNKVFLSPMAGVTDLPFRLICKEQDCGMLYTEMINAKALCYDDQNTKKMLKIEEEEHPVAVQIFGSDPAFMGGAAEILNEYPNEILDINMGCPAPKVIKNGDGSALMKNPKLAEEVLKSVVKNSKKPVTLKIRKGWDDNNINAVEIAKIAEASGISALAIHGRTREQYYSGKADWDIIAKIKESINIPVIGNGDVFEVEDAINMINKTNCDAIMIGRGAQGNPWIFKRINHYMKTGEILPEPTGEEKINTALKHLKLAIDEHGEYVAVREMRKHIAWYLKGLRGSARLRDEINKIESYEEVVNKLCDYLSHSLT